MSPVRPPTNDAITTGLPRRFGEYVLLEHLAHGGRGDVYVAVGPNAGAARSTCVLKCLREDLAADKSYVARFVAEARTAVLLQHPNIASVVDVGCVGGAYYLAFEHVIGRSLREVVERASAERGALPMPVVTELVCDLLDALDFAHRRTNPQTGAPLGFVHGEVSPGSLMIGYDGMVKLTDVGLARSTLELEMTLPGAAPGRLAYQAPEQVRGGDVDGRADLYSVAILAYELLTGERFYAGKPPETLWKVAGAGGYHPPGFARLPAGLRTILGRALEPDPETRTASCDELRRELREDQRHARARPGELKALMTALYPGAAAASRRHFEALARTRLAVGRGGETVHFMPEGQLASADAPTQVRDASTIRPAIAAPPARPTIAAPLPSVVGITGAFDSTTGDLSPATLQRALATDAPSHDERRPLPITEMDVATEPDLRPAVFDDDPQGPTAPLRHPAPRHLAKPPTKPR
ncbi:MAG: serine/threonine protein kinase [Deltaproteobacteria bacterium]|nr:serine/threonine protein kinase [Deltaproteobacteria bacterium]